MSEGAPELLRVAVIGATGAVGRELIDRLLQSRFPLQELVPVATDRSLGETVEWLGHEIGVEAELESLRRFDLVWICTPPGAALEWMREALRHEVACIDLSGAVAGAGELPLLVADLPRTRWRADQPVVVSPTGPALMLAKVVGPLRDLGLARVEATVLEAASSAGRAGIDALQAETLGVFQQPELDSSEVFPTPHAFDCFPSAAAPGVDFPADREAQLETHLTRALGAGGVSISITSLRVPVFAGCGIQLSVEFEGNASVEQVSEKLRKAAGVVVADEKDPASTRSRVGQDEVCVARLRPDPSLADERRMRLWIAADPICLAAANAVALARTRFLDPEPTEALGRRVPNYALTVEYDGTDFEGWQRQPEGHRSIQGVLEAALTDLAGHSVIVRGAGRTDAGVHAEGQLAAAELALDLAPERLVRAINARMPADVAIRAAAVAPEGWNPRFVKGWKRYRYQCWNGPIPSPLRARRFAHVPRRLDRAAMQRAAKDLEGTHDFAAFQGRGSSVTCTTRSLFELRVGGTAGGEIRIEARGDGFLKHMVRNLAGTLIEVGLGARAPDSMPELLATLDRRKAGRTAPAHGLVLVEVEVPLEAPAGTAPSQPPEG